MAQGLGRQWQLRLWEEIKSRHAQVLGLRCQWDAQFGLCFLGRRRKNAVESVPKIIAPECKGSTQFVSA